MLLSDPSHLSPLGVVLKLAGVGLRHQLVEVRLTAKGVVQQQGFVGLAVCFQSLVNGPRHHVTQRQQHVLHALDRAAGFFGGDDDFRRPPLCVFIDLVGLLLLAQRQQLDLVEIDLQGGNSRCVCLLLLPCFQNADVLLGAGPLVNGDLASNLDPLGCVVPLALDFVGLQLRLKNDALVLGVATGRHDLAAKQLLVPERSVPGVVGWQVTEFDIHTVHLDGGGVGYPVRQRQGRALH